MKEVLESIQTIDTKLDDCRYYLKSIEDPEKRDLLFDTLNEISKEVKGLVNEFN